MLLALYFKGLMIVPPTHHNFVKALRVLNEGGLIGLPTETVYGLAADATQDLSVASIFEKKGRPAFNPLILHGPSKEGFYSHVLWNDKAEALANIFWPGPLTLILPRHPASSLSFLASAGLSSLAVRVPCHSIALTLLQEFGKPLAAPSANLSGKISPTNAQHVEESFPDLLILDGGAASVGLESTIVDLTGTSPCLLRPGCISQEEIEEVLGLSCIPFQGSIKAPGMLTSHYAPTLTLRLNAKEPLEGEAYLAFGPTSCKDNPLLNLSPTGNLQEAAANFFAMMRSLDHSGAHGIAVAPIPFKGLGIALNDRLQRAAASCDLSGKEG